MSFGAPGTFLSGTDQTLLITCTNPNIAPLTVSLDGPRERFHSKYNDRVETGAGCDGGGVIDLRRIPGTITGTLEFYKKNSSFGAIMAALDQAFYNGLGDTAFTITSTEPILGLNGQQAGSNIFQYVNLRFHDYEAGDWTRDTKVKCTVNFTCSLRLQLQ